MWLPLINMVVNLTHPIVKMAAHEVQLSSHRRQIKVSRLLPHYHCGHHHHHKSLKWRRRRDGGGQAKQYWDTCMLRYSVVEIVF